MDTIFKETSDGIWIWDGQGRLIAVNEAAEKLGGVKERFIIGKNYQELVQDGLYDRSAVPEIVKSKTKSSVEAKSLRTGIVTINTGYPAFNAAGDIVRVVVTEHNITHIGKDNKPAELHKAFEEADRRLGIIQLEEEGIVAESETYRNILRMGLKLAQSEVSNILILGESGTGKGELAGIIHRMSGRSNKPFVQINCAAVPASLLEAELFGYESGAFTGARKQGKPGLFELARGGTLFLDEIGYLPFDLQAKLLKYLDDFQIMRLGGTQTIKAECSVIAATNCDLENLVSQGEFRNDLFYRINAFTLNIPPLRERPEDVRGLVFRTLERYNKSYGQSRTLSPRLIERLQAYAFPGNVRELKNIIERAVVLSDSDLLDEAVLGVIGQSVPKREALSIKDNMLALERKILIDAVAQFDTTRAIADHLGIDQSNVVRKLKKHGLNIRRK